MFSWRSCQCTRDTSRVTWKSSVAPPARMLAGVKPSSDATDSPNTLLKYNDQRRANAAGVLGHNGAARASPLSAHARNATVA